MGQEKRASKRATTAQKCLRVGGKHNDLENVGRTARHHTFFEMMGNFSFGDYFKEDAVKFAWEFLTEHLKLDKNKLYATVFENDDEAIELWLKNSSIPRERIFRLGEKDNFWAMGDTGPCGPCSEILYDQGEHLSCGSNCGIGTCDCDRFLEIWNLVFMQYDQIEPGKRENLPRPSIDTGLGLERAAAICQGVTSNYDTDLFQSIIQYACSLAGVTYSHSAPDTNDTDTALRVISDHSRSLAFMISDGILPSNEGRGYVLRRLIRRAYRFGRLIGLTEPFLHKTALKVVDVMGEDYSELVKSRSFMERVIREEEERFEKTLDKGLNMLEEALDELGGKGASLVPGDLAFRLYDTFGFPVDIVNDIAQKRGFSVDEAAFARHMTEQRERAKSAWKGSGEADLAGRFKALLEEGLASEFVGYAGLEAASRITMLLDKDAIPVEALQEGETGFAVTGQTPFYGESGGQTGDKGEIISSSGRGEVTDCLKPAAGLIAHQLQVTEGRILADQEVTLRVSESERLATARNHTATHLMHAALRRVLGEHVHQAGSLVGPDRLRFDFTHIAAMTAEELAAVEKDVNRMVLADSALNVEVMPYDQAMSRGATGLFGEKYEADVRVVAVPGESMELCGGTHLERTGQIGLFAIVSESGVAAGVRRIEAATGWNAIALYNSLRAEMQEVAGLLKGKPGELGKRIEALNQDLRNARKDAQKAAAQAASEKGRDIMSEVEAINGVRVLAVKVAAPNVKALRDLMDDLRSKLSSGVICIAAENEGRVDLLIAVSQDLHGRFTAPILIKDVAAEIGGKGGGRPDLAQAGGDNPAGLEGAFVKLKALLV